MNMFKPVKAKNIREYIGQVPIGRRKDIEFLHRFIRKTAPSLTPHFAYNMLGYGSFKYTNSKKQVIDWPTVALANQKNYISLYVCALAGGRYVAEKFQKELGKVSVGKSCIRFRNAGDLNLKTLETVIKLAQQSPGITK